MKRIFIIIILIGVGLVSFFQSCAKEENSTSLSQTEFHKKAQLTNIFENEITSLTFQLKQQADELESRVKTYQSNSTPDNLIEAQNQWREVQLVWKQLELYDLGEVASTFITFEINRWPTDKERIEENINGVEVLDEAFITSKGSSSKGIAALEYLLFSDENMILNASETYLARRNQYLAALTENLSSKSLQLEALWEVNEISFVAALENGIDGSQNQVINAMVTLIEEIIISKLGKPLGDTNNGIIEPERLEAYQSKFSKEIIQQHLIALKRCYKGDFAQTPFRVGFDDFLILIGSEDFSVKIANQFSECQKKLDVIQGTLEDEIMENPEALIELKDSFRDLLVLIKVDMANVLGSTITFNDNDGD